MAKRKNYLLFEFRPTYYSKEAIWTCDKLTRQGIINRLVQTTRCDGSNYILENLVSDMTDTEANKEKLRSLYLKCSLGTTWCHSTLYFLAKANGQSFVPLNIEDLIDELNERLLQSNKADEQRKKTRRHNAKLMENYEFRREPVPGVHNYNNCHRGDYYRHPATTNAKRYNEYLDEDYKFVDTKINKLPSLYDDLTRHRDKSWKTSFKVKKQWMKHLDKHIDTVNL